MRVFIIISISLIAAGCVSGGVSEEAIFGGAGEAILGGTDVTAVVPQRMPEASKLINAYRLKKGLGAVSEDPHLMKAAAEHARDLAAVAKVSQYGSDGSDPAVRARRVGYVFSNIGENVSAGRASLTEVIQAWIDSDPHRRNLELEPATHFGLAHAFSPKSYHRHYWVLVLGEPRRAVRGAEGGDSGSLLSMGRFSIR